MESVIKTYDLTKRYGRHTVVSSLTLTVPQGSVYGFLGPNGAGKSTSMKMLLGLVHQTGGQVELLGQTMNEENRIALLRQTGSLIESPSGYLHLTARENLEIVADLKGVNHRDIGRVLDVVRLTSDANRTVGQYSLGMKQRLGIAIALAGDPDFLILDEPSNGLDPQGIIEMRELILRLNRERQMTVLISSHILDELSRLATHYGIIDGGKMVKELSAEELENACRKCMRMEVTKLTALTRVLDGMGIDYKVLSETKADVYAKINISQLTLALAKEGCEVLSIEEKDESLESYFVSLVGGGSHG